MITWVIGRGGLLGSAVERQAGPVYLPGPIPWEHPGRAQEVLHIYARAFEQSAERGPWRVVWAAGAATTATPQAEALTELDMLEALVTGLRSALPTGPGCVFLASSAGGVYAGSANPPFDARTDPRPLSPYGELKLAQEALVTTELAHVVPVVIGRIANLYGPGQNLDKLQGLISRLALAAVTRQPINIFVPLDTIRDYIYADDAAQLVLAATDPQTQANNEPPDARIEVLASGQGTTIGQLMRMMNEIAKRRVPVALGSHASAQAQAADLRLTPTWVAERPTTLPAGMKAVHDDILRRVQAQSFAGSA